MSCTIRLLVPEDASKVLHIYALGMQTGIATFEQVLPDWETWDQKFLKQCRLVAIHQEQIAGWAALSAVSQRRVYRGVAEVSIYIDPAFQGKGMGKQLLLHLVEQSEKEGFWTLQAGIFTENEASVRIHQHAGFRIVGVREKIGQLNGLWKDNYLLERRSQTIG